MTGPIIVSRDFLKLLWIASHPANRKGVEDYEAQLPEHFPSFFAPSQEVEPWVMNAALSLYDQTGVSNLVTQTANGMVVPSLAGYDLISAYLSGELTDEDMNKGSTNYVMWLTVHEPHHYRL